MTIHEFGKENEQVVVLIHPSIVMWDYFEYVYPLMEKTFSTDELTDEDVQYAVKVLKMISAKTIWRTFESCNNYQMPEEINSNCKHIEYWAAEKEMKDRTADVAYIKRVFPHTIFRKVKNMGHGGLAPFNPQLFVRGIERAIKEGE